MNMKKVCLVVCFFMAMLTVSFIKPANAQNGNDYTPIPTPSTSKIPFSELKEEWDDSFREHLPNASFSFEYYEDEHLYVVTMTYFLTEEMYFTLYFDHNEVFVEWFDGFSNMLKYWHECFEEEEELEPTDFQLYYLAKDNEKLLFSCKNGTDIYQLIDHTPIYISNTSYSKNHGYYTFKGSVENFLQRTVKFVRVKLELLDGNGKVVDTDWTYAVGIEGLNFRDSTRFEIMHKDSGVVWKSYRITVLDYN